MSNLQQITTQYRQKVQAIIREVEEAERLFADGTLNKGAYDKATAYLLETMNRVSEKYGQESRALIKQTADDFMRDFAKIESDLCDKINDTLGKAGVIKLSKL